MSFYKSLGFSGLQETEGEGLLPFPWIFNQFCLNSFSEHVGQPRLF